LFSRNIFLQKLNKHCHGVALTENDSPLAADTVRLNYGKAAIFDYKKRTKLVVWLGLLA